jgi:MFS family permease
VNARRDLNLVSAASAAAIVGWSMLTLLLPLLALRFGVGAGGIGMLVAAAAVAPLLLAVPIGTAVDRWGARRAILLSFAGTTVALLPMVAQPSLAWLVVAFVAASALQNGFIIGAQALIATLGAEGRGREAAFGWWTTSMAAGQVLGPLVAGVMLDRFGARPAFVGVVVAFAVSMALMLAVRSRGRSEAFVPPFRWRAAGALLRHRTVGVAILTSTAAVWAMTIHATFLPVHLESLAMSAAAIGGSSRSGRRPPSSSARSCRRWWRSWAAGSAPSSSPSSRSRWASRAWSRVRRHGSSACGSRSSASATGSRSRSRW